MNFNLDFKALAYPASHSESEPAPPPCLCSLVFRCDNAHRQATLLLVANVPTALDVEAFFVLQYDADKLLSSTVSLRSCDRHISQPQLDDILRDKFNKRQDIKQLDLTVAQPCPLWCTGDAQTYSPKLGREHAYQQFTDLAKATTLRLVFDYKYLRKEHQGMFRAFSKAAKGLVGYPVDASLIGQGLRKASWEVFAPVGAAGAPPAYQGSRARKRSRQSTPNSPTQLPPPKRFTPQSPTESHASDKTIPFSPETATAALERALRRVSPGHDFQTAAINAAIELQLPAYIANAQAQQNEAIEAAVARQLPAYFDSALQSDAIEAAVGKQLDTVLQSLLPSALGDLLAPEPVPSSPTTSFDSLGNKHPHLPPLTTLGRTMLPHLRTHLTSEFQMHQAAQLQRFQKLVDKTLDQLETSAYDDRAREAAEFEAEMEEHKAELALVKRDAVASLWRETEDVFHRGREEGWALGEDVSDRIGGLCDEIEGIKKIQLRKIVRREVSRMMRRKKRIPRGVGKMFVRAGCTLLGRQREAEIRYTTAEEAEWIDC